MQKAERVPLNVLVIAKYDPTIDWIQLSFKEQNYELAGRVESVEEAFQHIERGPVDVIIADSSGEGVLDSDWVKGLATQTSRILILVIATNTEMEFVREAMLAGAHGFLLKPFDVLDLSRSIEQIHQTWLKRHALLAEERPVIEVTTPANRAKAIAVYSPKGGSGATTLAVNLAIALKQQTDRNVLLVDADLRTADIDIFLSIFSKNSILDLVGLEQKIDDELLERVATEHVTGISVIRGDSQLQFIESPFDPGQIGEVIQELMSVWEGYIVLNTSNGLDRWTIETLDVVDHVLVVTTPELPALRATRNFLELAEAALDESGKWKVTMNAYQGKKVLRISDIEASIHFSITDTVSEDFALVPTSINRGTPLITSHRKSSVAKDILDLAKQLVDSPSSNPAAPDSATDQPFITAKEAVSQAGESKRFGFWNSLSSAVGLTQNSAR